MNNIFVSWKQKIESRIISDLKSQYTESEEQIRQRKEQFLKKQKKIILIEIIAGAVFLAFLIIRAAFLQDDILLSRNSFGQGSKEVQLSLKKDDKKKEITYKLDEQKLSAEEESKVYIQFFKKLKKIMMKNNTSLKQIQTPLNLPDTVDGYPFEITYELAEDGYIRLDGSINEEEQAKLKRGETYRTYIVVTARYGEYRKSKKYEIRIVPKKNISQTNVFYKIQQYLKKEEQENRYSHDIKIPSVYKDIEITKRQENQGGISGILILFVTVCIFIPLHNYLKLQEEGKKCQEQAERDFPVIVHLLTLYMGAGLSFFSAVKRISQNYQKQRELDDSKKYAFEKMMRMEQQMSNGVSQREACQDWGMQFRTDSYQKLSLILIQSFTKGSKEAAMLMEAEEREAFHKRIDRAKKEGEEASTRLLFPMILLLCQVMLLVMYPALSRIQEVCRIARNLECRKRARLCMPSDRSQDLFGRIVEDQDLAVCIGVPAPRLPQELDHHVVGGFIDERDHDLLAVYAIQSFRLLFKRGFRNLPHEIPCQCFRQRVSEFFHIIAVHIARLRRTHERQRITALPDAALFQIGLHDLLLRRSVKPKFAPAQAIGRILHQRIQRYDNVLTCQIGRDMIRIGDADVRRRIRRDIRDHIVVDLPVVRIQANVDVDIGIQLLKRLDRRLIDLRLRFIGIILCPKRELLFLRRVKRFGHFKGGKPACAMASCTYGDGENRRQQQRRFFHCVHPFVPPLDTPSMILLRNSRNSTMSGSEIATTAAIMAGMFSRPNPFSRIA